MIENRARAIDIKGRIELLRHALEIDFLAKKPAFPVMKGMHGGR
jgi:hypothetical protein